MKQNLSFARNLSWFSALRFSLRFLAFIRIAFLARLLTRSQFGVFGIVSLALSLLEILTETGIRVFLIQETDGHSRYLNSAWVISILRGITIALLLLIASPYIADFFRTPQSGPLLALIALVPLIRGFINPSCVIFQKQLRFDKEFFYRLAIVLTETVFVVLLAFLTRSTASLVWGMIISALVEVLLSYILIRPWPHFQFHMADLKVIISRGKWVTGFGILDYLYSNGDNMVIGRLLGQAPLGLYQNAYKLSALPLTELVGVYYSVSFPSYSLLGNPRAAADQALKNSLRLLLLLAVVCTGLYIFADPVVRIILGSNWLDAVPIVRTLSFLGLIRGLAYSFNSLFMSQKKQHYVTFITLCSALGLAVSIVPLTQIFGIMGSAYSAIIGGLCSIPAALYFYYRIRKAHD